MTKPTDVREMRERLEALEAALRDIGRRAPATEPVYDDWGGDTERAETWGQEAGLWEAAQIARAALNHAAPAAEREGE